MDLGLVAGGSKVSLGFAWGCLGFHFVVEGLFSTALRWVWFRVGLGQVQRFRLV